MDDTAVIGACLTAPGEGGLNVFRLAGPALPALLRGIFRPAGPARGGSPALRHGHLLDGEALVDEVVVVEEAETVAAEVSTHGGPGTRAAVEDLLRRSGVTLVPPEVLAGPPARFGPAVEAEARRGLLASRAPEAAVFFLRVLEGRLAFELGSLRTSLRQAARRASAPPLGGADARLRTLLSRAAYGAAFSAPPVILVAGPPNAGKSTLVNALLGFERCIVTAEPGTTRDLVGEDLVLRDHPYRILDSAGLCDSVHPVEAEGVARALRAAEDADVILFVVDGTGPFPDFAPLRTWRTKVVVVLAKRDLGLRPETEAAAWALGRPVMSVGARSGSGVDRLGEVIHFCSPFRGPAARDLPCPFTPRQERFLVAALAALPADPGGAAAHLDGLLEEIP